MDLKGNKKEKEAKEKNKNNRILNPKEEQIINTKIIDVRKLHAHEYKRIIEEVSSLLNSGEVIVFPTETVYGLGANAFDSSAVSKIFKIKNRPKDNPLIVHISSVEMLKFLVEEISEDANRLINKFWPGPLTLILKKNNLVPEITTAGLDTIAIRMPNHSVALDIIKTSGFPIAAPSANLSGKPSATNAKDAFSDLQGKVPLIIDGGQCKIGIESTVINMVSEPYTILREGYITKEQIEEELKKNIEICKKNCEKLLSPGMKYKHYSPDAKVFIGRRKDGRMKTIINMAYAAEKLSNKKKKVKIIFSEPIPEKMKKEFSKLGNITEYENHIQMARCLFKELRNADKNNFDVILIEGVYEFGIGRAIMERIEKAADGNIEEII
ncbi:MAG: L-threonylcarbamoyladenylate synthase [Candidatus Micrarchaeia archaeon]